MEEEIEYTFSVETRWTLFAKYTSHVTICHDKVKIERVGRVGDIPEEVTIRYDDVSSITYTKDTNAMVSYIAFVGLSNCNSQSITGVSIGKTVVGGTSANPWSDPHGIVFKMDMYDEVKPYYKKMVEVFDEYKRKHAMPSVQNVYANESAMDKLRKLKELRNLDIITDAEYKEKREKILAEI